MSKQITLSFHLEGENLGLKSVTFDVNETDLPNDSELLKMLATTLLKSIIINKQDVLVQDLLNELDIKS